MISCDMVTDRGVCVCLRVKGRCTMGWWLWVTLWVRVQPPSCPSSSGRSILHCAAIPTPLPAACSGQCDRSIVALASVLHYVYRETWKLILVREREKPENWSSSDRERERERDLKTDPRLRERATMFIHHWSMMTLDKRLNWRVKGLVHAKMNILSLLFQPDVVPKLYDFLFAMNHEIRLSISTQGK